MREQAKLDDYFKELLKNTKYQAHDVRPGNVGRLPGETSWRSYDLGAISPMFQDTDKIIAKPPKNWPTDDTLLWGRKK